MPVLRKGTKGLEVSLSVSGTTRLFAVVGHPVEHSLSPAIHNFLFRRFALDAVYVALPVAPADFSRLIRALATTSFQGFNVTTPHKVRATKRPFSPTASARFVGAANTLCRTPDGWEGLNTDGAGLCDFLEHEVGMSLRGRRLVVLGAGPAARAVVAEAVRRAPSSLVVATRTTARFRSPFFRAMVRDGNVTVLGTDDARIDEALHTADVVVNGTAWGLGGRAATDPPPWNLSDLCADAVAVDMNYANVDGRTVFIDSLPTTVRSFDGRGMLRWQAAHAFAAWTGLSLAEGDHYALKVHLDELDRP